MKPVSANSQTSLVVDAAIILVQATLVKCVADRRKAKRYLKVATRATIKSNNELNTLIKACVRVLHDLRKVQRLKIKIDRTAVLDMAYGIQDSHEVYRKHKPE